MICPDGVMRPIAGEWSVRRRTTVAVRPGDDPDRAAAGFRPPENSVICPDGVIRPIAFVRQLKKSVNHRLPSGPAAIHPG